MEDSVYKSKYNLQGMRKKEKVERVRTNANPNDSASKKIDRNYTHRNYSHLDGKNKTVKKLHLN